MGKMHLLEFSPPRIACGAQPETVTIRDNTEFILNGSFKPYRITCERCLKIIKREKRKDVTADQINRAQM